MAEKGKVTIIGAEQMSRAFRLWIERQRARGKSDDGVARYAMKIWVDYAFSKVKARAVGNKGKIESDLMRIVAKFSRRFKPGRKPRISKAESKYAGTLAERVVRKLNYGDARTLRGAAFFRVVGKFVANRKFSAWHHKAGFFPIYGFLRKSPEDRTGPKYQKHPSGAGEMKLKQDIVEIMVTNQASAAPVPGRPEPLGIAGLVPGAFEDSAGEMQQMLGDKAIGDAMKDGMAAAGTLFRFKM